MYTTEDLKATQQPIAQQPTVQQPTVQQPAVQQPQQQAQQQPKEPPQQTLTKEEEEELLQTLIKEEEKEKRMLQLKREREEIVVADSNLKISSLDEINELEKQEKKLQEQMKQLLAQQELIKKKKQANAQLLIKKKAFETPRTEFVFQAKMEGELDIARVAKYIKKMLESIGATQNKKIEIMEHKVFTNCFYYKINFPLVVEWVERQVGAMKFKDKQAPPFKLLQIRPGNFFADVECF